MTVRFERPGDEAAIDAVNLAAFDGPIEAALVRGLRRNGGLTLSLVAERAGHIVGHVAFSPVTLSTGRVVQGLGPVSVLPNHQRHGVGRALIEQGLAQLKADGHELCVVLGHPSYYPRFGFVPAPPLGLRWERGHDHAFMVCALVGHLSNIAGVARYRPEFDAA
ncbi:MAG: N-acetyltransferase [Myxococcaceae bacterium]